LPETLHYGLHLLPDHPQSLAPVGPTLHLPLPLALDGEGGKKAGSILNQVPQLASSKLKNQRNFLLQRVMVIHQCGLPRW